MKRKVSTTQEPEDTRLLIRYLLGDLIEEEQEKIEERYASDDNFYFKLLAIEDELIDSFVLGQISPDDRARFEQVYLSNPHRLKKVESNKIFLELVTKQLSPRAPWYQRPVESLRRAFAGQYVSFRYAFATLLLVGILGASIGWLLWDRRWRAERAQANSEWTQKQHEYERQIAELKQRNTDSQPTPSPVLPVAGGPEERPPVHHRSSIVMFVLPRGGVRAPRGESNALKPLVIWRGADLVRLTVDLEPNDYPEYRISLQKIGEDKARFITTLSKNQPGFSAREIVISLPADLFETQDYILKVTATDPSEEILAFRHLQVINKNLVRKNIKSAP
jgi:hypothetical protein